jgi:hypothetical protein
MKAKWKWKFLVSTLLSLGNCLMINDLIARQHNFFHPLKLVKRSFFLEFLLIEHMKAGRNLPPFQDVKFKMLMKSDAFAFKLAARGKDETDGEEII